MFVGTSRLPSQTRRGPWRYVRILGLLLLLLCSGCAAVKQSSIGPELPTWPPPPLPARIKFIRNISSNQDLSEDTTFSQKIIHYLGGETPKHSTIVEPMGLTVSADGSRLYVSDSAQLCVYIFDFKNKKLKQIDGLYQPMGVAIDSQDNLYIVEQVKRRISVYNTDLKNIRFITHPSLVRPTDVVIDSVRNRIYVSETGRNDTQDHCVRVFNMEGELIDTIGTRGIKPGEFLFPTYLALDREGNLYVTDTLNSRVQKFSTEGKYLMQFGERGTGWGMFDKPKGVGLDSFGNVYVVDTGWSNVQIFNQKGEVLLFFGGRGPLPGMLKNPTPIAIDARNRIYIGDFLNTRVAVYQLVNTNAKDSYRSSSDAQNVSAPQNAKSSAASGN